MKSLFALLGSVLVMNAYAASPVVYHEPAKVPMPNLGESMQAMPVSDMPAMHDTTMPAMPHHAMPHAQAAQSKPKTVIIQHGQSTISVKLNANATTGYSWVLGDYDHSLLNLISYHYQAPQTRMMGAGGQAVFTFHVDPAMFAGPQVATLTFHYARLWEYSGQEQAQVVHVISVGSSAGQSRSMASAGLTTRSTVANPYTPPMQTTNAMPMTANMDAPSTAMPQMHSTTTAVATQQHADTHANNNTWLSLPAGHQSQAQQ